MSTYPTINDDGMRVSYARICEDRDWAAEVTKPTAGRIEYRDIHSRYMRSASATRAMMHEAAGALRDCTIGAHSRSKVEVLVREEQQWADTLDEAFARAHVGDLKDIWSISEASSGSVFQLIGAIVHLAVYDRVELLNLEVFWLSADGPIRLERGRK